MSHIRIYGKQLVGLKANRSGSASAVTAFASGLGQPSADPGRGPRLRPRDGVHDTMSTTDKRVEELLDRWLASVDLHARYLQLDDAAYARAEAWPKHQRPNAFVVKLARTRLLELKKHLADRRDAGDEKFAEALELMSFLTSLLGSEHIERFIPLATGKPPDTSLSATVEQPRLRGTPRPASRRTAPPATTAAPPTRSASPAKHGPARAAAAPHAPKETVPRQLVAARARPAPVVAPLRAHTAAPPSDPATATATASAPVSSAMAQQVIADAVRMLAWGREWPAVAGLIARMADRPSEAEIWKVLRAHRTDIMARARRGAS